jgi:arylsulfatase A-like enzyme
MKVSITPFHAIWFGLVLSLTGLQAKSPNILLIIADDLGADSFPLTAVSGASLPPMPHLTALKNSGVLFDKAYSHPVCSPARASMLTGRHPFRTGIGAQLEGATSPQLQASEFTLPEAFAAHSSVGYSLAMFGKWHLTAGPGTNDTPRTIGGWPHFAGSISGALPDYLAWTKVTNGVSSASSTYATTDAVNDTISWISAQGDSPWFAWVALNAPHSPYHQPPLDLHSYDAAATTNRNQYEAMCEAMDTELGRLLAGVDLADTTVIFIGDNGTPAAVIQPPYSAAHSKGTLYEGGVRVPLLIAGNGIASPNRTSSRPVHAVDLYATILELAGIDLSTTQPAENPIDSVSLMPILKNTPDVSRQVFIEQFSSTLSTTVSGQGVIDEAGYKLLQFDDGHEEFYRTGNDPNEATSLLGSSITAADQAAYAALKLELAAAQDISPPNSPLISSWFVENSGQYARIYPTLASMNSGASVTTWSRGAGVQSSPTYADVHQIDYSANWVYIRTTGLASHVMGPWYLNAAKTNLFPNYPANTAKIYRIPRTPSIPVTKTSTGLGDTGRMVNGVSMFDSRDAFSYSTSNAADAVPNGSFTGDGIWNRDGYHNEGVTFDPALAHQAGNNYHYHAQPIALRHQLGDHVDYNPATNTYVESSTPVTRHSPILAWAADGLPVYGPYGYSAPMDPDSGVRRMVSGFALRSTMTTRTTLPAWAARLQGRAAALPTNQQGPAVSANFLLGHYIEDFDYLGDLGFTLGTHFDLNEQNVRFCVSPEYPAGTWAYFTTISADSLPTFPYTTGRQFYGSPTGGLVTSLTEIVNTAYIGGPLSPDSADTVRITDDDVILTWNAVESGIYSVEASENLSDWNNIATGQVVAGDDLGRFTETDAARDEAGQRFYRATRTGLGTYDRTGFAGTAASSSAPVGAGANTVSPNSGARGSAVSVVIELPTPLPPANVAVSSITFGSGTGITVSNITRYSQTLITATFTLSAGASTGARNVIVTYNGGVTRTLTNGFTAN